MLLFLVPCSDSQTRNRCSVLDVFEFRTLLDEYCSTYPKCCSFDSEYLQGRSDIGFLFLDPSCGSCLSKISTNRITQYSIMDDVIMVPDQSRHLTKSILNSIFGEDPNILFVSESSTRLYDIVVSNMGCYISPAY